MRKKTTFILIIITLAIIFIFERSFVYLSNYLSVNNEMEIKDSNFFPKPKKIKSTLEKEILISKNQDNKIYTNSKKIVTEEYIEEKDRINIDLTEIKEEIIISEDKKLLIEKEIISPEKIIPQKEIMISPTNLKEDFPNNIIIIDLEKIGDIIKTYKPSNDDYLAFDQYLKNQKNLNGFNKLIDKYDKTGFFLKGLSINDSKLKNYNSNFANSYLKLKTSLENLKNNPTEADVIISYHQSVIEWTKNYNEIFNYVKSLNLNISPNSSASIFIFSNNLE